MAVKSYVFTDTAAFCSWFDARDLHHQRTNDAIKRILKAGCRGLTTDYIIDETCTLLKARCNTHAALRFLSFLDESSAFEIVPITPERLDAAKRFFRKHADHGYSFTDCASFVVMKEFHIRDALTTDRHFIEAGFRALLLDD